VKISVQIKIDALIEDVWDRWVSPDHIVQWNFASDDWCCPSAKVDFSIGRRFKYRMEAKDGSMGFDFEGTFVDIKPLQQIRFELEDNRQVEIQFSKSLDGKSVEVIETFEAEDEMSGEQQRQGWQSILNNFKAHVESAGA
jgi:uncharacterized protein YndB with AHSA1/START domain